MTLLLFILVAGWVLSLGWLFVTLCYFLGQFANVWNHAASMIASKAATEVQDLGDYLSRYGSRLLNRFLWNTVIVIVVTLVPKIIFPTYSLDVHIANLTPGMALLFKCAVACAFGLGSDVILKKAQDVARTKGMDTSGAIAEAPTGRTVVGRREDLE